MTDSKKAEGVPTFEEAWAKMESQGYQYGRDALEQVRFGWEIRSGYPDADPAPTGPDGLTAAESHCATCVRCQAYRKMADDEARRHAERATELQKRLTELEAQTPTYEALSRKYALLQADVRGMRNVLGAKDDEGNLACAVRAATRTTP